MDPRRDRISAHVTRFDLAAAQVDDTEISLRQPSRSDYQARTHFGMVPMRCIDHHQARGKNIEPFVVIGKGVQDFARLEACFSSP